MLLDFDTAGSMDTDAPSALPEDRFSPGALLARVRKALPALLIRSSRLEQSGGDHLVLVVNDEQAFRFPREGVHDLRFEVEVLRQLRSRSPIAVPAYDYVDPAGRFAGYRFIDGQALARASFVKLGQAAQTVVLDTAAAFLVALHDLPQAEVGWSGTWPRMWTAAQYADRGLSERLPSIIRHAPQLADQVEAFYHAHRHDRPEHLAIVHGDLVCEHLLIDPAGSMVGVIDFGDVALGDPAQDLLGFWSYGADAVAHIARRYDPRRSDPDLLRRSRNHFIRHSIDNLFEGLRCGTTAQQAAHVAAVEALLTTSTIHNQ